MIRHGSPDMTVAPMAHWPMTQRIPISEMTWAQGTPARKTNAVRRLTSHEIMLIRSVTALPDRQRLPASTIPKPLYP